MAMYNCILDTNSVKKDKMQNLCLIYHQMCRKVFTHTCAHVEPVFGQGINKLVAMVASESGY
jgi:hypothetical protein